MKMDKVAGSGQDEFYTPRYAVEPIVQYLKKKKFKTIWCPFDTKDSQFVKVLKRENFKVIHTHISKGKDFFKIVDKGKVPKCDAIVSNPPYSKKTEVLTYLFELGIPFAMLLGIAGLFDSQERARLFSKHNFEVLFLNPRVDYFSGEDGKFLKQPPFQSVYICHDILPKKLLFAKVNKSDSVRENPLDEYTQVVATQEGDVFAIDSSSGYLIDDLDLSSELGDPGLVAERANIHITRDKIFLSGYVHRDKLVAVLFVTDHDEDCFSFDIAVLPEYQGKGLGSKLLDIAIQEFENQRYTLEYLEDYDYCITVVNPIMKTMLENRGFFVYDDHYFPRDTQMWMMHKIERENPSSDWFLEPQFLKNDENGYLINPDTNDIYWYHGACPSSTSDLEIYSEKESSTLYLTSSEYVADNIAYINQYDCELDPTIYKVTVEIHADRFFDVRYALSDEDDRQFAMEMFQTYYLAGEITERDFSDIVKLIGLLSFEYYDFKFNEYPYSKDLLQRGFVGWIELETSSMVVKYGEPITLAILQDARVEQYIRVVDMKGLPYEN